jgi:hypothetical protein
MMDTKSVKKMWVKPEVTGISAMSDAAIIGKSYYPAEGTFTDASGTMNLGPAS